MFAGVAVAALLFLVRMSRSVIRRQYRCEGVRSRKARTISEIEQLGRSGSTILALELQGALFFGSGERLAGEIAAQRPQDTRYVILDLRRVSEIDSTGAQILLDINAELAAHGQQLLLSLTQTSEAAAQLAESGVADAVGEPRMFQDLDRAIEWAEDELLRADGVPAEDQPELPLGATSAAAGFTAAELALLEKNVERRTYPPRGTIFREGDAGDELFIVVAGSASAHVRQPDGRDSRLVSFAPGTVFGELAILDTRARSATVATDGGVACYVLATKSFAALSERSPAMALKLIANLGRELSHRLRAANRTIQQLEE